MRPKVLSVSAYQDAASLGQFQGRMAWLCGSVTDPYKTLDAFHARRAVPVGERTDYDKGAGRWKNAAYSRLVDRIGNLPPGDRRIGPLFRQALEIFLREVPVFGIQQAIRIVPYNTTYWRNWPTAQNNYIHPPNWWMTTHQVLLRLRPAR
jgi:peptide/nickel transport system substrate-binding protein